MRYFLRRRFPGYARVLIVESGPRQVLERFLPGFLERNREEIETLDLVTCFSEQPAALPAGSARVYRTGEYGGADGRERLIQALKANRYATLVVLCADSPILAKWKAYLAWKLPAAVLIVNENGDYFHLNRAHWSTIVEFALTRSGLQGASAAPTLARVAAFPFTFVYLLLSAMAVHLRRRVRA
ncbi:MAG: hypothetical protein IT160_18500 [Bryobacterales bacterium]|nr:hypothetical protein [Bryobacterales bacterium]